MITASGTPISTNQPTGNHLPEGWRWVRLKNLARMESGHTPSRKVAHYWGGDIPWLSLKDIRTIDSIYVTETVDRPTIEGINNSSARILPKGTVALCRTASVGKVAILGRDMATSQDFVNWVCGPELLPEFLYFAFRSSASEFDRLKQGTTHKTIYMPTAEQFRVLLPPLHEQRRIAAVLETADTIRRKREEGIRLTEELPVSLFHSFFGDLPLSAYEAKELFEVSNIASGVAKGRRLNPDLMQHVPYLRVANVQDGYLDL